MRAFLGFLGMFLLFFAFRAFAQELPPEPSIGEWVALLKSLGGLKGAGTLAIVAALVQGAMLLLRSKFGDMAGKWRLSLVYLMTLIGGVVSMMATGVSLGAALIHSTTLAAFQVFLHQIVKQFSPDKAKE